MAKSVKKCLNGWELNRVLSVTVDNASSNDVGFQHLKRWLHSQNGIVLNGEYLHTPVRYVRRTPSRFQRFKKCIDHETIGYKGYVGRDCETQWNSTYLMLKGALKHNKTFTELEFRDQKYFNEMSKDKGVPRPEDWEHVELILPFLQIFHEATERISGSSYVTSNTYMLEVFGVGRSILNMCNSEDQKLVVWMATRIYDTSDVEYLKTKLGSYLKSIFDEYSGRTVSRLGSSVNLSGGFNAINDLYHCAEFYQSDECSTSETELQKYIQEEVENRPPNFDVLEWWKNYILRQMPEVAHPLCQLLMIEGKIY
ncbi:zinc finger BED domain-containing protein RICESLEEPER 1 [Lathyrus oleraceus]|uniref:zinc finger BED domain-containing protein RICESLEEPER 1 n=1 Tax=Pisum sativum TaxID=3888 RepID=UPI0021D049BB|nr:zinc finger BED domain-containing protein RICESLEEPER 1-like [Pisum sativum]